MGTHKLIVLSNARLEQDDAFNRWYDEVHIPDVLKVPGVVGAQRFRLSEGGWGYLAIYELDCEDPASVTTMLLERAGTELMPMTEAFDLDSYLMTVAAPLTPPVELDAAVG